MGNPNLPIKSLSWHCIPATIVILGRMTTYASGKLDRRAIAALPLPDRDVTASSESVKGEMTVREGECRLLWGRVLLPKKILSHGHR